MTSQNLKDRLSQLSPGKKALLALHLSKERRQQTLKSADSTVTIIPDHAGRFQPFPLTDLQQAYWIGRSGVFDLGNVASHTYLEFENTGLDVERLNRSWQRLVSRHDMLRAIVLRDGRQQILENVPPYRIQIVDLRGNEKQIVAEVLQKQREELSHQVLPTDQWPMFEIRAARLDGGRMRVFLSFDALILDAWSMALLFREWSQFYQDLDAVLPALELSFRDYVLAERALENGQAFQRAKEYWTKRVETLAPASELPQVADPALLQTACFVRRQARLDAETWSRLKARATKAGLTPSGVLMAAYVEVLTLWSRSPRFTINVPQFNRRPLHPQVDDVAGEFASFTLLEVDNSMGGSFEERARAWQHQLWTDLDHGEFGGVKVLRELARIYGRTSGGLMPVVFTSLARDSRTIDDRSDYGILGELVYSINQTSQVWLDNHVTERGGVLVCDWDSVDEIFPKGMPQEMLDAYFQLLRRLADEEQVWRESFAEIAATLIPPAQMAQRVTINGRTATIPELLAHDLFLEQVPKRPRQPAVVGVDRTLTYDELQRISTGLARRLRKLGARPNSLVAVVMEKGWEQIVAVLGVMQAGAAYLPIDAQVPRDRLWYLLQNGEVNVVLTQSPLDQSFEWPEAVRRICVDKEVFADDDDTWLEPAQKPDDLIYVLYTSGSTGAPKGVMIDHDGVVNSIVQTNAAFGIGPEDRVLALTALHHDMSVYDIFGTLGAGGTIVMPQASGRRDPAHWSDLMTRHGVTVWNSVPAMMEMMLEYASGRTGILPSSLRLAFLGGDWINVTLPARLKEVTPNANVVSVGGPTETTLWNIWHPVDQVGVEWKSIPYGRPIANVKYYILNEALADCPTWVPGEQYCAGAGLAKGYWRDEENTRTKFLIHPRTGERLYRTGDVGRYLPDGNIEFVGRSDFQVKIQGQRIELGEIESVLQQHPSVRAAVTVVVGDKHGRQRLVAYVIPSDGRAVVEQELRTYVQGKLPEYMVPSAFVKLDKLPLTPNGKVNRLALPEIADAPLKQDAGLSTEADELTSQISCIASKVLQVDSIDLAVNLMTYGANSIDMVRIGNQLEKEFGFRPRIDQLFRLQTVSALAGYYRDHFRQKALSPEVIGQGAEPDVKSVIASYRVLLDPEERDAFKENQLGLRRGDDQRAFVELEKPEINDVLVNRYRHRKSHRKFSLKPIPLAQFSRFLSCLFQLPVDGKPKYLYASPGGLHPTQVYLHIRPGRVSGLSAGAYYYHPVQHRLIVLTPNVDLDRSIHIPFINTPIFDEAAFSIFLVVALRAIAPGYGEKSIHFATLEAGLMAHLLETSARDCDLGLCQIGSVDFERIRELFHLEKDHVLIHSLLGGMPSQVDAAGMSTASGDNQGNKAAGILERIKQLSNEEVKALLQANKAINQMWTMIAGFISTEFEHLPILSELRCLVLI